jgi:hypothetical protein
MIPSNKEMRLCKNCQLYAYVLMAQGKEVPEEIQACIASYDYVVNCVAELSAELKGLDSDTFERIVNNKELLESRELSYWWEMQQEADRLHDALGSTCL